MSEVLEPELTILDRRILRAVGTLDWERRTADWRTVWQIAEAVNEKNVLFVEGVLEGLRDRRLVMCDRRDIRHRRELWLRTRTGDEELA